MTVSLGTDAPPPAAAASPPSTNAGPRLQHVPGLDGLRGLAVIAVLLYHAGVLTGGYLGVDLFFVLSGFLITSLMLAEHGSTGQVVLVSFWARRVRRLLPALLVFLLGVTVFAVLWAQPIDLHGIRSDGLATLGYVANWRTILSGGDYWAISLAPSPLQHMWSLAIEEQVYLLWPLIVFALVRGRDRWNAARAVLVAALGLAVVSVWLFVGLRAFGVSQTRVYQGTDTRAFSIMVGAALAAWRVGSPPGLLPTEPKRLRALEFASLGAAVMLGWAWVSLSGTSEFTYQAGLPLCSILGIGLVAAVSDPRLRLLARGVSLAPLRAFGAISYGLYLWHWPVFLVINEVRTGLRGNVLVIVRIAVSVAFAVASYYLVERPIRRRPLGGWVGGGAMAMSSVLVAGMVVLTTSHGVSVKDVNVLAQPRHAKTIVPGAPRVMYVGDSVPESLVSYLIAQPARYQVNPINASSVGCDAMYEGSLVKGGAGNIIAQPRCTDGYDRILATEKPDVVVLLYGVQPTLGLQIDGTFRYACQPEYRAEMERRYRALFTRLRSSGAELVVSTVARITSSFRAPDNDQKVDCVNATIRSLVAQTPGVGLVDLDRYLCPGGTCRERIGGERIRPDSLHFHGPAGEPIAAWFVAETLRQAHR